MTAPSPEIQQNPKPRRGGLLLVVVVLAAIAVIGIVMRLHESSALRDATENGALTRVVTMKAPQGPANVVILAQAIDDMTASLPLLVVELARVYLDQIDRLSEKVAGLEKAIACEAKRGAMTRRLQTMPGVGPITAMAIETFAPPMEVFRRGRDFAAWLGLVPVQHSTGGKQVLGKTSKMGQRDIRRLLITGAMVIVRWACRKGAQEGTWLHRMLGRKPRMLVAIALANKMARSIWAMLTKGEDYRGPVAATL